MKHGEDFRSLMVELVKASGQEVIDRAEDLVGNGDLLANFDILLKFTDADGSLNNIPTIEVVRSYISKNAVDVLSKN